MNAGEIMTSGVAFCSPDTNLASAAASMWQHNCGVLPVVDEKMHVTGMITDRDICIALATRNRLASDVTVGEVTGDRVFACRTDDDVQTVLTTMREHKVRRVPIVDRDETLAGIVSLDDIALFANERKSARNSGITYADAIATQRAIVEHPLAIPASPGLRLHASAAEPADGVASDFDIEE